MKIPVRIHGRSLQTLPTIDEVGGGRAAEAAGTPVELRLRAVAAGAPIVEPPSSHPAPPKPSAHAFDALDAAAERLARADIDPRVATMLRRARTLIGLQLEVEALRRGGLA